MPESLLICALTSFTITLLATAAIVLMTKRWKLAAPVMDDRWHRVPKSHFGGVAIFMGCLAAVLLFGQQQNEWLSITACATAMFLLGLLDDIFDLKAYIKFIYQIAIASAAAKLGVVVAVFQDPILATTVSIIWIVMITNAFNLLDNMDGLAGGIALITIASFLALDLIRGNTEFIVLASVLIGALAAFLIFNFPPAKIFMGDSGALFVGFLLSVYSIKGTWHQASNLFLLLAAPLLLLTVPIFDTIVVSIQRLLHGKPVSQGGRDHSSHRLVAHGWSEREAILILYAIATVFGAVAVLGYAMNVFITTLIVLLLVVFLLVLGLFLGDVKVYKADNNSEVTAEKKHFILSIPSILHKRRLVEIVIDTILIVAAYFSAHLLRFEGAISGYHWKIIQESLPIIVPVKLLAMLLSGMYGGVWKYIDFSDVRKIITSVAVASLASVTLLVGMYRFSGFSRSLFFIDFMVLLLFIIGFRFLLRWLRESLYGFSPHGKPVLVVGAGEAGQWVLNEIRKDRNNATYPVGLIDDDHWKQGKKLYGVQVLGKREAIPAVVKAKAVEEIILAVPSANQQERAAILKICKATGIPIKILERITSWSYSPASPLAQPQLDGRSNDSSSDPSDPFDQERLH